MQGMAAAEPGYGRAALSEFLLDPQLVHLNHGSYGALSVRVSEAQNAIRAHIERDPTTFFQEEYPKAIRESAAVAAAHFGGQAADWVFCENATAAVNSVLSSLSFREGDELLTTSHAYGAVTRAMRIWAARRGASLAIADVPTRVESEDEIVAAIERALTARTRLLVVDHITSATAIVFPIARIVEAARRRNVPVMVDGAHVPGQIPVDVPSIGADWYTGNAHKWLFAPKGCALLWTAPKWQAATRPVVLSHGSEESYTAAFDWIGTRDVSAWLSLRAAVSEHERLGGRRLMERNCALAAEAARFLEAELGGRLSAPRLMAAMASIALPHPPRPGLDRKLRSVLVAEHKIVVPVSVFAGKLWVRVSAQAYNVSEDYGRLAFALHKCLPSL